MLAAALNCTSVRFHHWSLKKFDFHIYCKDIFVININHQITDNDYDQP